MTRVTRGARMTTRQWERGNVRERRTLPRHRTTMAIRTCRAKASRNVVRLRRTLEVRLVTSHTVS